MERIKIEKYDPQLHNEYRDKEDYYNSHMRPPEEIDSMGAAAWEIKEYLEYNAGSIELAFEYAMIIMGRYILLQGQDFMSAEQIERLKDILNKYFKDQLKTIY